MSHSSIGKRAIRVLVREMGATDAARFVSQFTTGHGNYTRERGKLFEGLTIEDIVREIRDREQEKD